MRLERVGGTPIVSAVGQPVSDGHYTYAGRSGYAGANGHYEHAVWDGSHAGVATPGAIARSPAAGGIGQPVSDRRYEHADWSSGAGAIRRCDDRSARDGMARAAKYVDAAGNAVPI